MPYRRLPNTDKSRIRALEKAFEIGEKLSLIDLAYSQDTFYKLKIFLPKYKQVINSQQNSYFNQIENSKKYKKAFKTLKIYLSHFIQVLNFAIIRNEIKPEVKKYYKLKISNSNIPKLNTEQELINWSENLINGEKQRIIKGGSPILNPKIAMVQIYYEKFLNAFKYQKTLQDINHRALSKISNLRPEADNLIQQIWNEIEKHFNDFPSIIKREKAKKYGLIYVYRKNEKKIKLDDIISIQS